MEARASRAKISSEMPNAQTETQRRSHLAGLDDVARSLNPPSRSEGLRVLALQLGMMTDFVHVNPWLDGVQLPWPLALSDADKLSSYGVPLSLMSAFRSGRLKGASETAMLSYLLAMVDLSEKASDQLLSHRHIPLPASSKQNRTLVEKINCRCKQRMGEASNFIGSLSKDWTRTAASYEIWACRTVEDEHVTEKFHFSGMANAACAYDLGGTTLTGGRVWAGALLLIHWADSLARENVLPLTSGPLLELGSGTGVVGIVLARLFGLSEVMLSDREPVLLEVIQDNININDVDSRCNVLELDWESVSKDEHVASQLRAKHFSCVVGSDVIYDVCHAELVADVVQHALHMGGVAVFANASHHRPGVEGFAACLRARRGFRVLERRIPCGSVLQELVCGEFEPEQEYAGFLVHVEQ